MPLDPQDPTLQVAMQKDADQAIAQQLGFAQQQPKPGDPLVGPPVDTNAQGFWQNPNLSYQQKQGIADAQGNYQTAAPAAPAAPPYDFWKDPSLSYQQKLDLVDKNGGHAPTAPPQDIINANNAVSANTPANRGEPSAPPEAPPDMSKVVTAGPGAGPVPGGQPAPQVQNVAASWTDTLSPNEREEFNAGHQRQLAGLDTEAQTQGAAADEIAGIKGNAVKELGGYRDQQAEVQRQREGVQQHYEELAARRRLLAEEKIDPEHWQKAGGSGRKVGMAIAMALGSFGASMTHTQNTAAEIINKHIEDQTRADEGALANKKEGVRDEMNLVEHKTALLGDKEKGIAAAKQQRLGDVLAEIDATAAKYQRPEITARAEQLKGELMQQFALHDKSINVFTPAHQVVTGGGANAGTIRVPIGEQGQIIRLPDGRMAHVGDVKVGSALNEMGSRVEAVHNIAARIEALTKTREAQVPGTAAHKELQDLRTDLSQALTVAHNAGRGVGLIRGEEGAISGREVEGARGALAAPGALGTVANIVAPGRELDAVHAAVKTADKIYSSSLKYAQPRIVTGGRPGTGHGGSYYEYDVTGDTYQPKEQSAPAGGYVGTAVKK